MSPTAPAADGLTGPGAGRGPARLLPNQLVARMNELVTLLQGRLRLGPADNVVGKSRSTTRVLIRSASGTTPPGCQEEL
jgi:hypothetical protein